MHIDELCSRFNLSRKTINMYVCRGIIPRPTFSSKSPRSARYGPEHVAALTAYRAVKDNNASQREIATYLAEEQIDIVEYVRRREAYIRDHGLSANAGQH